MEIKTAEENFVFNTKKPIPANMEIAFKDGNPENIKFSNLKLARKDGAKPETIKPTKDEIPADDQEKPKVKKAKK
jgi:hypothetical protein